MRLRERGFARVRLLRALVALVAVALVFWRPARDQILGDRDREAPEPRRESPAVPVSAPAASAPEVVWDPNVPRAGDFTLEGIIFGWVEAGSATLGSPSTEPGRDPRLEAEWRVTIPTRFALSRCEITIQQYWSLLDPARSMDAARADHPMTEVTWDEAVAWCAQLSAKTKRKARLPTEVEWEFACRGGRREMFSAWRGGPAALARAIDAWLRGDDGLLERGAQASFRVAMSTGTGSVGRNGAPSAAGFFDMHGNAWEWCAAPAAGESDDGPSWLHRPIRGGAWTSRSPFECRSAKRAWERKDVAKRSIGFRVLIEAG